MMLYLLALHIGLCCIVGILYMRGIIKIRSFLLPTVFLVPIVGIILLGQEIWIDKKGKLGKREIGLEKLKIQDVMYQRLEVSNDINKDITVPLEEAILINDAKVRRKLMLDILHRNPEKNIQLLQKASMTEDTELSHYATTAMMNIQSHYELEIHEMEEKSKEFPDDVRLFRAYRRMLKRYINSGLIAGTILKVYQTKLDSVLQNLIRMEPLHENYHLDYVYNRISMGAIEKLDDKMVFIIEHWPEDEKVYKIRLALAEKRRDGEMIQRIMEEIREKDVYLSSSSKEWFRFWSDEERRFE